MARMRLPVVALVLIGLLGQPLSPLPRSPVASPPAATLSKPVAAPRFQSPLPPPTPPAPAPSPPPPLPLPPPEEIPVTPGTAARFLHGRVTVEVPPAAPIARLRLAMREQRRLGAGQAGIALAFDLQAADGTGAPLSRFAAPLTITLRLGEWVNWSSRPDWLRPWVGYFDEAARRWVPISPTFVDEAAGILAFPTDHLSVFGAGTQGVTVSGWVLNFNDTRVDRFAGALVWAYPLDLPPGPGGIRPTLGLAYNSRRIDGVLTWAQSDGVGWGWSLDVAEIMWRNVRRCWDGAHYYLCWDAVPLLVLNGEALKLVPETALPGNVQYLGPGSEYHFRTEDERFWRIVWKPGPENGWWEVTLPDGTRYRLGTTPDSRQTLRGSIGQTTGVATVRWRVKEIVYPAGVTAAFTYTEQTLSQQCDLFRAAGLMGSNENCTGDDPNSERASYLTQIEYPGTRVRIVWDRRWNGNGPNDGFGAQAYRGDFTDAGMAAIFWQTDAVQRVVVERQRGDGTWAVVREIRFTYGTFIPEDETNKRLRILTQIQEWAPEGSAWKALPPLTFGYTGYPNKDWCNVFAQPCSEWDQARFFYPRLTRLDNGYGGRIEIGYETPDGGHWQAKNYRVAWRTVTDGLGGGWQEAYAYSGDPRGRCYLFWGEDQTGCTWPDAFTGPTGGPFLGYREVSVAIRDLAGSLVRSEWNRFALPEGPTNDPWPVRGRMRQAALSDPDGRVLQTVDIAYGISPTAGGAHFVFPQRQDTATDGRTARTEWRYDAYGNVTAVFEHGFLDVSGDERTTHRGYAYNLSAWILDKVAWERVYEGLTEDIGGTALQTETRFFYDGASSFTTPPTKGLLTRVDRGKEGWGWVTEQAAYDAYGNPTVLTDARGFTTTFGYDPSGVYRVWERNALGHTTRYEYYGVNESDPGAGRGPVGALKRVVDPNGAATAYTYDPFGRLVGEIHPGDSWTLPTRQWVYGTPRPAALFPNGDFEADGGWASYGSGIAWGYAAGAGRNGSRALWIRTTQEGDHWVGNFSSSWQAGAPYWIGAWVRGSGGVCLTVSARAGWEQAAACGTATTDWQWLEGRIVLPPDATQFHLLIRTGVGEVWIDEVRIGPPLTPWRIERWDREVSGCSGCVQPTFTFYNGLGWKLQERIEKDNGTLQSVRNWVYDPLGRVMREDLPVEELFSWEFLRPTGWESRPATRTTYDALDRPLTITAPDGSVTRYAYADGGVLALDPNGHQTLRCTDGLGRLAEVYTFQGAFSAPTLAAQPLAVARYRFNALDRLTDVRDPLGNRIRIAYDPLGRKVRMDDPAMGTWFYRYDPAGNLLAQVDGRGWAVNFYYDPLNRLKGKTYTPGISDGAAYVPPPDPGPSGYAVGYAYDEPGYGASLGRKTRAWTADGIQRTWAYDPRGRVTTATLTIDGQPFLQTFAYDAMDRLTRRVDPDGEALQLAYGPHGWPTALTGWGTYAQNATYNAAGQLTGLSLLGGGVLNRTYDPRTLRVTRIQGPGLDLGYAYDPAGNVLRITDTARSEVWTFAYDELDRLIGMSGPVSGTWTLDEGGRWLQRTEGAQTWTYDYGDPAPPSAPPGPYRVYLPLIAKSPTVRCLDEAWHAAWVERDTGRSWRLLSVSDGTTLGYDGNGNVLTRTVGGAEWRYVYDAENRLAEVWRGAERVAAFRYDAEGNRTVREVAGVRTVAVDDGYEVRGGVVRKVYRLGGEAVAVREGGGVWAVVGDHLGSLAVLAQGGSPAGLTRYLPYGAIRLETGLFPTDRRFTGQRWEVVLGLYDYRARFYDPTLGRFLQPDSLVQADARNPTPYLPLAVSYAHPKTLEQWNQLQQSRWQPKSQAPSTPAVLDPQFLNRYAYARNNPLAYVDDTGHIAWWVVGGIFGGVVGLGAYALTHRDRFDWREAALWTAGGAVVGATFGAGAQWVAGALGTAEAATTAATAATATSPWALPALQRGQLIHRMLGANLPPNFPVIDRFVNGVATSIKTLDLNAPTYQNISMLTNKVQGYINTLANFQGARHIQAHMITGRELLLAVPSGAGTQAQWAALQALQQYAANLGVILTIVQIP